MEKHGKWQKKDTSKSEDDKLDEALEDSFPASDPPSQTDPSSNIVSRRKVPQRQPHDGK